MGFRGVLFRSHDPFADEIGPIDACAHFLMLDPVDAHMRDDGPPVRFRGPKGFQTGIMSPEPAVRIKPGLFGCDAPLAQSTRRDLLELAVAAMVQSEIVGASDRKTIFATGDM